MVGVFVVVGRVEDDLRVRLGRDVTGRKGGGYFGDDQTMTGIGRESAFVQTEASFSNMQICAPFFSLHDEGQSRLSVSALVPFVIQTPQS